jgi:hypothetical protein
MSKKSGEDARTSWHLVQLKKSRPARACWWLKSFAQHKGPSLIATEPKSTLSLTLQANRNATDLQNWTEILH